MLSRLKIKTYTYIYITKMNRKITTAIFGRYDPWIADSALLPIDYKYRMSQYYKQLKEEEMKYLLEKWYFLSKFFDAKKYVKI